MNAVLVMFKADGERKDLPLTKPVMILGRKHTCDLRIPLSSVSREHCQIEQRGDDLYVRDLGSSNGTYHNETRVLEAKLKAGDVLQVGPVHFTVVIDGQPDEIEPVRSVIPDEDEMAGTPPRGTPGPSKPAAKPAPASAKSAAKSPQPDEDDLEELESLDELEGLEELGELENIDDLEILEDDDDDDTYARPQTPPAQAVTPVPAPPPKPSPTSATPKPKAPAPPPPPTDDDPIAALEALMDGDEDNEDDEPITLNFDDDDDER